MHPPVVPVSRGGQAHARGSARVPSAGPGLRSQAPAVPPGHSRTIPCASHTTTPGDSKGRCGRHATGIPAPHVPLSKIAPLDIPKSRGAKGPEQYDAPPGHVRSKCQRHPCFPWSHFDAMCSGGYRFLQQRSAVFGWLYFRRTGAFLSPGVLTRDHWERTDLWPNVPTTVGP